MICDIFEDSKFSFTAESNPSLPPLTKQIKHVVSKFSCCVKTSKVSRKWNWLFGDLGMGLIFFFLLQVTFHTAISYLTLVWTSKTGNMIFLGAVWQKPGFLRSPYQCFLTSCECTRYFSVLPFCPPCLVSCHEAAWNDLRPYQPVLYRQSLGESQELERPRIDFPDTIWKCSPSSGGKTLPARRKMLE